VSIRIPLDDPRAVDTLSRVLKRRTERTAAAVKRLEELKPLVLEHEELSEIVGNQAYLAFPRTDLAFALLYREIGTEHVKLAGYNPGISKTAYEEEDILP
jgi:hypothetical protein